MAITKIQSESLNLADTYAFTGTVTGAGQTLKPAFSAYLSASQSVTDATWTKVQFNTEILDSDGTYDNSTNYRFTPASTGYYLINAGLVIEAEGVGRMADNYLSLYKNGTQVSVSEQYHNNTDLSTYQPHTFSQIINCTSTSDYYECYGYGDVSTGNIVFAGNSTRQYSYFNAFKLF